MRFARYPFLLLFGLVACQAEQQRFQPVDVSARMEQLGQTSGRSYTYRVLVNAPLALEEALVRVGRNAGGHDALLLMGPEDSNSMADVRLDLTLKDAGTADVLGTPQFVGILSKRTVPGSAVVSYRLSTSGGKVLDEGQVTGVGAAKSHISPLLSEDNTPSSSVLEDIAGQIVQAIKPHVTALAWRVMVVGQSGPLHIITDGGQESGLHIGDRLITETLPRSIVQVVSFEEPPQGGTRAVLNVLNGPVPTIGKKLVMFEEAHPQ